MNALKEYAARVEKALKAKVEGMEGVPPLLQEAMAYSLMAGGKRLRPVMLLAAVDMLGGDSGDALDPACAVEMIHTSSLIHDDLPGMDNDVLRRGRPTNHVVYGEGQAILAGDALLNLAGEILARDALAHPSQLENRVRAMEEILRGAGPQGMMGGQCLDLSCQQEKRGGETELMEIQLGKTCRMFIHPLRAAGWLAGAGEAEREALGRYGEAFGRMFQTADDLLDVEGSQADLGKSVGKDAQEGKLTAVAVYGLEGARNMVERQLELALEALACFGQRGAFFRELVLSMKGRKR